MAGTFLRPLDGLAVDRIGQGASRRDLLLSGVAASLVAATGRADAAPASTSERRKLVVVILRGAMDGLAALPKLDDPHIEAHRADLIDRKARPLSDGFALHSAMPALAQFYAAGEAAFLPAVAGPYRERSHFAAQDLLECGHERIVSRDGWLNRALQAGPAGVSAVSIGPSQPLILRGAATATASWSPSVLPEAEADTIERLMDLYEGDAVLQPALAQAIRADAATGDSMAGASAADGGMANAGTPRPRGGAGQYAPLAAAAGRFLAADAGADIAVVSLEGWDTHAGQDAPLQQRFAGLDAAMTSLRQALGPQWARTVVVAVSEFGRTVRMNGARGTDHGTGGLAILAGGAVRGGRVAGDWPGLSPAALYEDRDLRPTIDIRSVFKGLLTDHMGWDCADVERAVFPDSASAAPLPGLTRA